MQTTFPRVPARHRAPRWRVALLVCVALLALVLLFAVIGLSRLTAWLGASLSEPYRLVEAREVSSPAVARPGAPATAEAPREPAPVAQPATPAAADAALPAGVAAPADDPDRRAVDNVNVSPPGEGGAPNAADGGSAGATSAQAPQAVETAPEAEPVLTCGPATCASGQVCCNASCGICADPGESCSQRACGMPTAPYSQSCGMSTCNVGQVCCNASCGICTLPNQSCDQTPCTGGIQYPLSEACGMATCNVGLVCCNASCGICALPGQPCSHEVCD